MGSFSCASIARAASGPLRRAHDFRTPAPRREYWGFLPVGLSLPCAAASLSLWLGAGRWAAVAAAGAALLPLIAVTTRRAIDSGEPRAVVLRPALDLAGLLICLFALDHGSRAALAAIRAAEGPSGFGVALLSGIAGLFLLLLALHFLMSGLLFGAALFSQMAAPSAPTISS